MYAKGEQVPGFAPLAPLAPPPPPTAAGGPDSMVRATQVELVRLGYLEGGADGYMGPRTRGAISSFEQANGLPVDGSPSRTLLARLQSTPTGAPGGAPSGAPRGAPAPAPTASAPSNWVAPAGPPGAAPPAAAQAAPPPAGWVAPKP
jgi:peptidoglycan hydrolase-like protein with peptidoglycan-binding domain